MTDLSHHAHGVSGHVPLRVHVMDSALVYGHLLKLLLQYTWRAGERSAEALLHSGEAVTLRGGFKLDGTTLVVKLSDEEARRVPASSIVCIRDNMDNGYGH